MSIRDRLLSEENLIANGFKQDGVIPNVYYYNGVPYDINNQADRSAIEEILNNIQYQSYIKDMYEYEEIEPITKVTKKITTERTKEILPTHKEIMTNTTSKEYNTLGMLISKSNFNKEGGKMEAYVYEKDIETKFEELKSEGIKVPCLKTIKRHIKTLASITLGEEKLITIENSPNGIVYKIAQNYEGKYFVTIPCEQLKELLLVVNKEVLKLYCIFKYKCNEDKWIPISRKYLVKGMGLTEGEASENYISVVINALRKLGYIKIDTKHTTELDENNNMIYKKINYYQLTTFDEWKNKK